MYGGDERREENAESWKQQQQQKTEGVQNVKKKYNLHLSKNAAIIIKIKLLEVNRRLSPAHNSLQLLSVNNTNNETNPPPPPALMQTQSSAMQTHTSQTLHVLIRSPSIHKCNESVVFTLWRLMAVIKSGCVSLCEISLFGAVVTWGAFDCDSYNS